MGGTPERVICSRLAFGGNHAAFDPITNLRYRLIEGTVESIMGLPVFIGKQFVGFVEYLSFWR